MGLYQAMDAAVDTTIVNAIPDIGFIYIRIF